MALGVLRPVGAALRGLRMQAWYEARFEREMGCTEADLLQSLPGAVKGRAVTLSTGAAEVVIDAGRLALRWQTLPMRQIALVRLPRLAVSFEFIDVSDEVRQAFMRYFDLYTQRGGG